MLYVAFMYAGMYVRVCIGLYVYVSMQVCV